MLAPGLEFSELAATLLADLSAHAPTVDGSGHVIDGLFAGAAKAEQRTVVEVVGPAKIEWGEMLVDDLISPELLSAGWTTAPLSYQELGELYAG